MEEEMEVEDAGSGSSPKNLIKNSSGLVSSPLKMSVDEAVSFEQENVEVMELADSSSAANILTTGTPLVFVIPHNNSKQGDEGSERGKPKRVRKLGSIKVTSSESSDKKGTSSESDKYRWLAMPQRELDKMTVDSDWSNVSWVERPDSVDLSGDKGSWRRRGRNAEPEDGWETLSEAEDDPDGNEWEEQLVYVEIDDLPSVQELFAIHPDDFLRFQHRKLRHKTQPRKATHPRLNLKFHQFNSSNPILQVGKRYFGCNWEEPTGTALFFRKKDKIPSANEPQSPQRPCQGLKSIVPNPEIPWDPVFGGCNLEPPGGGYEMVAMANKILKTKSYEAAQHPMYKIPKNNRQLLNKEPELKIPRGYTLNEIFAGMYRPKKKKVRKQGIILGGPANEGEEERITGDIPTPLLLT